MDIVWILDLDPDPHENFCGFETLLCMAFFGKTVVGLLATDWYLRVKFTDHFNLSSFFFIYIH